MFFLNVTKEKTYSESASVNLVGTTDITIDGKVIELNGTNYGGMIIISKLIEKIFRFQDDDVENVFRQE